MGPFSHVCSSVRADRIPSAGGPEVCIKLGLQLHQLIFFVQHVAGLRSGLRLRAYFAQFRAAQAWAWRDLSATRHAW
jgi:hypothetical protein